ncbi:MAG TPA: hypothetical protein VJ853_12255 [Thermoanaerobaculia bacterium]|nr:hypothetical protein [Thermoanaerobaculia bacterium]
MQHLTEQELVLHHYHDDESPAAVAEHLLGCDVCRAEYSSIRKVLALVDEMPVPERGDGYGEQVWARLRWKLGNQRNRTRSWHAALAAAAVLAIAFFAGVLWHARSGGQAILPVQQQTASATGQAGLPVLQQAKPQDRILLVVVTDHLDSSERMLRDVANADPKRGIDLGDDPKRAEELVASNRIYRQTAVQHGDDSLASVLNDLEPVLLEIAHSDGKLSPEQAATLQKRIESKGLLFKVRVMTAQKGTTSI